MTVASMPIEVGARPLYALVGALNAAKKIAAADDDGDFDPGFGGRREIAGDARQSRRVEAVLAIAHQRLARQLDDHALPTVRRTGVVVMRSFSHSAIRAGFACSSYKTTRPRRKRAQGASHS